MITINVRFLILKCLWVGFVLQLLAVPALHAQKAYFIDGYHGGVWGHYPDWNTRFMVDMLNKHPDWRINIEIEPETWDRVKTVDPEAFQHFKAIFEDQSTAGRIEYVNPSYGQSFLYNTSGESIIRQFHYGIERVREHFPNAVFTTYSSEEPCFTSALPQILASFGFKYASLKNPNTCWGGYTQAFGGELVNWVGPDGTKIVTVPRYEIESLAPKSTWQTIAWNNSEAYLTAALEYGIKNPIGMCLQDAGWKGGPWLGNGDKTIIPTTYKTWRDYIENVSIKTPSLDWKFSQDDLLVSLVWGSQILQRLAQQVRYSEHRIIAAEKLASMAKMHQGIQWPGQAFDDGWRNLSLAQHHDCWIVPYNGGDNNWAVKAERWTGITNHHSDSVIQHALSKLASGSDGREGRFIRVFNTLGVDRIDFVSIDVPTDWGDNLKVVDHNNQEVLSQFVRDTENGRRELRVKADVPSFGYVTYRVAAQTPTRDLKVSASALDDGTYQVETDLYKIILDPAKGGTIKSLVAKTLNNKEFVDQTNERKFNELRGNFYNDGGFYSSAAQPAAIEVVEHGPASVTLKINGHIGEHPFVQTLTVKQGEKRIDLGVDIDWQGSPGIGNPYAQTVRWRQEDRRKAFYDDRDKLLALFPLNLASQKVYKNAPFDVTESQQTNTFFTTWDSIKHSVILNWVDIADGDDEYGLTLLSDHTTSYAHGENHPLGLTLKYAGVGLWGRNYRITRNTAVAYSIIPHQGKWDEAGVWTEGSRWNEPLIASVMHTEPAAGDWHKSLIAVEGKGIELTSAVYQGEDLLVRFFNAEGGDENRNILINGAVGSATVVALNGELSAELPINRRENITTVNLSIPRYGIRTVKLSGFKVNN